MNGCCNSSSVAVVVVAVVVLKGAPYSVLVVLVEVVVLVSEELKPYKEIEHQWQYVAPYAQFLVSTFERSKISVLQCYHGPSRIISRCRYRHRRLHLLYRSFLVCE